MRGSSNIGLRLVSAGVALGFLVGACATPSASTRSSSTANQQAQAQSPQAMHDHGQNPAICNSVGTQVQQDLVTERAPYVGRAPGSRITYNPGERSESEVSQIPDCPK